MNDNKYYRITYKGIGIYEAYRQNVDFDTWKKYLNSPAAKWLPKPPVYKNSNTLNSYFTQKGYDIFMKTTYGIFIKKLNPKLVKIETVTISKSNILYDDEYQIVIDTKKTPVSLFESIYNQL